MPCLVAVLKVVGVAPPHDEREPEKVFRQVDLSQWSTVVPHQPYWLPGVRINMAYSWSKKALIRTALIRTALGISIGRAAVSCKHTGHERKSSED